MSHSRVGNVPNPQPFGQSETLFVTEGNSIAILVISRGGRRRKREMRFADPPAALAMEGN